MREIKFRGMSVDLNKWIYGYLFVTKKSNPLKEKTYWIFNEYGKYKISPETAEQYTGQKDKKGEAIYEGDIVKSESTGIIFEIIFDNEGACFRGKSETMYNLRAAIFCETVGIGNIHDKE